jgi:hypothetical protein
MAVRRVVVLIEVVALHLVWQRVAGLDLSWTSRHTANARALLDEDMRGDLFDENSLSLLY